VLVLNRQVAPHHSRPTRLSLKQRRREGCVVLLVWWCWRGTCVRIEEICTARRLPPRAIANGHSSLLIHHIRPHCGLPGFFLLRENLAKSMGLAVTLSVGTPLCPCGIACCRVYKLSTSGLLAQFLCSPLCILQILNGERPLGMQARPSYMHPHRGCVGAGAPREVMYRFLDFSG